MGFYSYATHDRMEYLDRPHVSETADSACEQLSTALAAIDTGDRRQDLEAGDVAIRQLVATMRGLGEKALKDDSPALGWIGDWELVVGARQSLAAKLGTDPSASFVVPQTPDGHPITRRMRGASGRPCNAAIAAATTP